MYPPVFTITRILAGIYIALLLLPARGLLRKNSQTFMWSSYLILIYFSHGIIESWANETERLYAISELALSILYFFSSMKCYGQFRKLAR